MICSYFDGRLGNQFFRYAFARLVRFKRGDKDNLIFNFNNVINKGEENGFEDILKYYNVLPYRTSNKNLILQYGSFLQKCFYGFDRFVLSRLINVKTCSWRYKLLDKIGLIYSREDTGNTIFSIPNSPTIFTSGKFEDPKYLDDIKQILQEEFIPKFELKEENKDLFEIIRNTNSVCITIRRGDYVSTQFKNDFFVCDKSYFNKGIEKIKEIVDNPTFVLFSDDIEWAKNNIIIEGYPVFYESGNDPIWEKLRLMSSCKHFVISNSTFSWWAQYLCTNKDKKVVSPNKWFANPNWVSYLIQNDFIQINT